MKPPLPFRLGSTSYVYPAGILPNVRRLAPVVDDIELVLFEAESQSNLPSPAVVAELGAIAAAHDLTYTVHLPLDLRLADEDGTWRHRSIEKARQVIERTRGLHPWAYVVHLDGSMIGPDPTPDRLNRWRADAARSLNPIVQDVGDPQLLAIENLEDYAPAAFLPLVDETGVSLCADVGHFVKVGQGTLSYIQAHAAKIRVVHIHGSEDGVDHRGLDRLPEGLLAGTLDVLLGAAFSGVLTVEVFAEGHFFPDRDLVLSLVRERL